MIVIVVIINDDFFSLHTIINNIKIVLEFLLIF